ncbi:hypothetical protein F4861DRAFT_502197 [Xylaria intraflava]|nr:hypothetical protein F4861DRAFT_502197 [Xylaria intraflava]
MKSISVAAAAALLAGISMAQPHGHHHHGHHHAKRELVTEWDTVWETVTVLVDESTTQTLLPTPTGDGIPGQFFQPPSSTSSEPQPTSTVAETPSSVPSVQAPPPATTLESSTSQAPPPPATTSTSTSSSTPIPTPTLASTSTSAAVAVSVSVQVPAPEQSASTPSSSSGSSGYVYAGADKFGTSPMDSETYKGDVTYYNLGIGACGYDDTGKDLTTNLVAISQKDWMARNPGTSLGLGMPNHPWCDQTIKITAGGKTATATVHDNCPGCASGSIDVSEAVFDILFGGLGVGRSTATWDFV